MNRRSPHAKPESREPRLLIGNVILMYGLKDNHRLLFHIM